MRERNLWLLLGGLIALTAWQLTRTITHVDHGPRPVVTVAFDERPPQRFEGFGGSFVALQRERERFPVLALIGRAKVVFLVTPATRSIAIRGLNAGELACFLDESQSAPTALLLGAQSSDRLTPLAVATASGRAVVPVPERLRRALARSLDAKGAIVCSSRQPVSVAGTFTERSVTIRAEIAPGGAVLVDFSALEDIDDLRLSGGLQLPFGGERTRLLYGGNNIMAAEWADVSAQEQRDIILVIVGALSAIAAATIIEGIRPFIEGKSKRA